MLAKEEGLNGTLHFCERIIVQVKEVNCNGFVTRKTQWFHKRHDGTDDTIHSGNVIEIGERTSLCTNGNLKAECMLWVWVRLKGRKELWTRNYQSI